MKKVYKPYSFKSRAFLFLIFFLIFSTKVEAFEHFLHSPNNYGVTGLMSIPTARVMKKHTFRIGVSNDTPYNHYYFTLSPMKGLELNALVTQINGLKAFSISGYRSYKDKSIDIKYQLFKEGKYTPAVAIGLIDPYGQVKLYSGQYIALSKKIYPFDFTVGLGNGRLGKEPLPVGGSKFNLQMFEHPRTWLRQSNVFWGFQFSPSKKWALMLEYDPIEYTHDTSDPAQSFYFVRKPPKSHYNIGLRLNLTSLVEVDLTYQRGDTFGFNISMPFVIGRPMIPIVDHIVTYEDEKKYYNNFEKRLAAALYQSGFRNIKIKMVNDNLWLEAENDTYFYTPKAIKVIGEILSTIKKKSIKKVHIILAQNQIPILEFDTTKKDIDDYINGKLKTWQFLYLSKLRTDVYKGIDAPMLYPHRFTFELKPSLETFLNDPSGFFRYRIGFTAGVEYRPWEGGTFFTEASYYPINNIGTINHPLSIPVRSDLPFYLEHKFALDSLLYNQIFKFPDNIYTRLTAGVLEIEYSGVDTEIAKPFFHGKLLLGLSGSLVKKRSINNPFAFSRQPYAKKYYHTEFLRMRYYLPFVRNAFVDVKYGRFLAGDKGFMIRVSKVIKGVTLSAWYSFTNTNIFTDPYNRGYHNFGIAASIPFRLFKGRDMRTVYNYSLSPWSRDVAQDISHYDELFDYIGRNTKYWLYHDFSRY